MDSAAPCVHAIALDPSRHWQQAWSVLTAAEQGRAAQLRDLRDRQAFVFAHSLLRLLLAGMADRRGASAADADYLRGSFGKPRLAPPFEGIHFSLSYRRGAAALAVGDAPLGIDVEAVRPDIDMLGIGERFFTAQEQAWLRQPPAGGLAERFFELWTRKEALIKAAGVGIDRMPSVDALKSPAALVDESGTVKPYCVHQLASAGTHAMALAVELSHVPA